jgi:imidazolonepropionase
MDIHRQGGGIHKTVRATREASHDELLELLRQRFWNMLRCGTTLVECKTGYGLDFDSELKQLQLLQPNQLLPPIDRVITFLGAHAIPEYVKCLLSN